MVMTTISYYHNGKVYEADGIVEHPTSNHHRKIRAALSKEIHGQYESLLAGHIGWKLNARKTIVNGKKIVEASKEKILFNDTFGSSFYYNSSRVHIFRYPRQ
jgi:hypothetical protein